MAIHSRAALLPVLTLLPLLGLSACMGSSGARSLSEVQKLVDAGEYAQAVAVAQERAEDRPGDPQAERVHRLASAAYLLDQGRQLSFAGRNEEALDAFVQAADLAPDSPQPAEWVKTTRDKLSRSWIVRGSELRLSGDLPGARKAYRMAAAYDPSRAATEESIADIDKEMVFHAEVSKEYYNEGISNLREGELNVAHSRFSYSQKHDTEGGGRAGKRLDEVAREISRRHAALAESLELGGYFSAARVEYHIALTTDPENPIAGEGLKRMHAEAQALEILKRGEMWLLREDWDRARETLVEGRAVTAMQQDAFDEALVRIEEAQTAATYQLALTYEHDFRFEEAIAKYEEILVGRDFYLDTRTRVGTLRESVERARALYDSLESEADPGERMKILRQIDFIWPGYEDVQEQMDALSSSLPPSAGI